MFSLKTLYPGEIIRTRAFCSCGGCDVHCATPPGLLWAVFKNHSLIPTFGTGYLFSTAHFLHTLFGQKSWLGYISGDFVLPTHPVTLPASHCCAMTTSRKTKAKFAGRRRSTGIDFLVSSADI
jgi:hypothetical protein